MKQVQVRLSEDEIAKLDTWAESLRSSGMPGTSETTRSTLIREAVIKAIRQHEDDVRFAPTIDQQVAERKAEAASRLKAQETLAKRSRR